MSTEIARKTSFLEAEHATEIVRQFNEFVLIKISGQPLPSTLLRIMDPPSTLSKRKDMPLLNVSTPSTVGL